MKQSTKARFPRVYIQEIVKTFFDVHKCFCQPLSENDLALHHPCPDKHPLAFFFCDYTNKQQNGDTLTLPSAAGEDAHLTQATVLRDRDTISAANF